MIVRIPHCKVKHVAKQMLYRFLRWIRRYALNECQAVLVRQDWTEFSTSQSGDKALLAFFAGVWCNWTAVRKVKEGEVTTDVFGFLTTDANAEVGAIHPKAMPVILTKPDEPLMWMTAPAKDALKLQRPLPDGMLKVVARGEKKDPPAEGMAA